ncbi:MAG: metallo-beta-lactamase [Verrucomicrobia bacterium]|jgi:metallo-beta-lactamase family protein|nr:metallo-beta-lactamase [Verrucomicrobiota bacterium]
MQIQFLGAARTTTGSQFLLDVNGQRILLECGLFQGHRDEMTSRNCCFQFDPTKIDCAILSHAHIDHCGNFPNLCKQGFRGNIYCTFATRDLASIMLADSAKIQQADAQYVSKKRAKQGKPPVEPLYSIEDAEMVAHQFVAFGYDRPMLIADGVTLTFKDAGHILGSAQVVLDVRENGRKYRYLFSGDVGRGNDDILRDPAPVENVDFLQIESTYGNRDHVAKSGSYEKVLELVKDTIARNGKIIIPAFSVGRTQDIVYALNQLHEAGQLPHIPIFVDSPLSVNATEIYRLHPECFNQKTYEFLRTKNNPFGMENLTYIREMAQSMKLNDLKEPAIIISASGMCEAGRVRHHLKNHISDPSTTVLFIGYCADHTLGAAIRSGRNPVNIFGEPHRVNAKIAAVDSFSGHADRNELKNYVQKITGDIKKIFIVHGEEEQSLPFADTLKQMKPGAEIVVPEHGQKEMI